MTLLIRNGLTVVHVIFIVTAVLVVGALAYGGLTKGKRRSNQPVIQQSDTPYTEGQPSTAEEVSQQQTDQLSSPASISWDFAGDTWKANGTPPTCPSPVVLQAPADLEKATGVLYPGQTRGGNYKPHGGLRFDGSANNAITVKAPYDALVVNGARYLAEGEIQYTFDFISSCGIMYRMGHFRELPEKLQKIADTFPAAAEGDSRTTFVNPPVSVKAGETIATSVGIVKTNNAFFDWGVYDLRQKNAVSSDAAWASKHADDNHLAPYAVCWFDMLPAAAAAKVKSLPAGDPASGTTSDYCK